MRVVGENDNLKHKLRALLEQYDARDSHFSQQVPIIACAQRNPFEAWAIMHLCWSFLANRAI